MGDDALDAVREAIDAGEWATALDLLTADEADLRSPDALELLAIANYGAGRFEDAVTAWEELHTRLIDDGDHAGAARAAAMVAMFLMMDTGMMAPVRGWLRRAERLLDGLGDSPTRALIAMTRAYERLMSGDIDSARTESALAMEIGARHDVNPAVVIGRVAAARVRILDGDLQAGLDELDEVGALLMAGGTDSLTTGMMYCELICAAQGLALHERARDWTEVMERWRHGVAFGGINGRCRVHRAEMLRLSGPCDEAEREALEACEELRPWMRREFGWPLAELGTIRLRRGDLAGAEEALRGAYEHAWSPHPGLALLYLERGEIDTATSLILEAIDHPLEIPSKELPPFGELRLAPLLDAQAEIASAAGDAATAEHAARRLRDIANAYPGPSLDASATLADARAALLRSDFERAIRLAGTAAAAWADVGAPFETATARSVAGEAHDRAGNAHAARMEREAAAAIYESYGATRRAVHVGRLAAAGRDRHPETSRPGSTRAAVFSRRGDTRQVSMGRESVSVRDLVGFRYIERMLAEPGREFHVLDLVAVEQGTIPSSDRAPVEASMKTGSGPVQNGLPALDDRAREAYRRRLAEIDEDIDEAKRMNDLERVALAERDRDYLVAELSRAVGLGGRVRTTGGASERARTSVTRSIRYAVGRLNQHHPTVAGHLQRCIRTGTYCSYQPDPLVRVDWEL